MDALDHRIFVTSTTHSGNLNGLTGADSICQSAALGAGLSRRYKAILSSSGELARDRLELVGAVYTFDISGTKLEVVSVGVDLWGSNLSQAVQYSELGLNMTSTTWTGSDSDGGNFGGTLSNCSDWTSSSSAEEGSVGDNVRTNGLWLEEITPESCDTAKPIYCISQ